MTPMAIQSGMNYFLYPSPFPNHTPNFNSSRTGIFLNPIPQPSFPQISRPISRRTHFPSPEALAADTPNIEEFISDEETKRVEFPVKQIEKPRLVLKFIWMEKNIGLGLDQVIPGHGSVPLSPYFFWPRKDAWEELKIALESKPWISQKKMIILLNQATDIINLWQQSGGNLTS